MITRDEFARLEKKLDRLLSVLGVGDDLPAELAQVKAAGGDPIRHAKEKFKARKRGRVKG